MATTFTPGPWEYDDRANGRDIRVWGDQGCYLVAVVSGNDVKGPSALNANARLISEAPALLTRLQASNELLKWLSNIAVMLGETEHGEIAEAIAANDAAIQNAKGGK